MKKVVGLCIGLMSLALVATAPASAAVVVDIDGVASGTYSFIDGVGADFAQSFVGQTISGTTLTGSPAGPLTLNPVGELEVAFWNTSNSILPQPGNQAPLSVLLESAANSISWTMGYADGPNTSVTVDFFDSLGGLVHSTTTNLLTGYNNYTYSGFTFNGLSIYNNDDPAGLRYQQFSYNAVPEPTTMLLLGSGLVGMLGFKKKKSSDIA